MYLNEIYYVHRLSIDNISEIYLLCLKWILQIYGYSKVYLYGCVKLKFYMIKL